MTRWAAWISSKRDGRSGAFRFDQGAYPPAPRENDAGREPEPLRRLAQQSVVITDRLQAAVEEVDGSMGQLAAIADLAEGKDERLHAQCLAAKKSGGTGRCWKAGCRPSFRIPRYKRSIRFTNRPAAGT